MCSGVDKCACVDVLSADEFESVVVCVHDRAC